MARKMVAMRLPRRTIDRLKWLARSSSQSDVVTELVDEAFACPVCGNRDMDYLPWDEDENGDAETVTCGRCGHTYNPLEG